MNPKLQHRLMAETEGEDAGGTATAEAVDLGSVEDQAKRMGWSTKEEYRGDPARWVDAKTYVKNGMEALPVLRERNRKLQEENILLAKSAQQLKDMNDKTFDRAYAQAKREAETALKAATKAGDEEGASAAAQALADNERVKAQREQAQDADPVYDAWERQNAWVKDPDMAIEAEVEALRLRKKGEKAEGVEFLDKVKSALKARMPEKFGNPRRTVETGVERSQGGGEGGAGKAKSWDTMPAEAKQHGERFIKQKLFSDKAAYAKSYWAQFE